VQVDPTEPKLKAPGTNLLTLEYGELLSTFAFKVILRRYNEDAAVTLMSAGDAAGALAGGL